VAQTLYFRDAPPVEQPLMTRLRHCENQSLSFAAHSAAREGTLGMGTTTVSGTEISTIDSESLYERERRTREAELAPVSSSTA
jgi:hypothetical protein